MATASRAPAAGAASLCRPFCCSSRPPPQRGASSSRGDARRPPAAAWLPRRSPLAPPPPGVACRAIRGVDSFDSSFQLEPAQQEKLDELLYSELFCAEVAKNCKLPEGTQLEFTGILFQPVPWSPTTKKGMPLELEQQYYGKEEFTFINVPPVFMFQAKIFQPPRLCAIYKRK